MPQWLSAAPSIAQFLSMRCAELTHAYWIGFGFVSLNTTRYYYPMLLTIEYLTEPLVWHVVRALLHQRDAFAPPSILTLLSHDFTLETELAGAFLGFFAFHFWFNRAGTHLLGLTIFVITLGGFVPVTLMVVGALYSETPLLHYMVFWLVGFIGGVMRSAAIASIFVQRMDTWVALTMQSSEAGWRSDSMHKGLRRMMGPLNPQIFEPLTYSVPVLPKVTSVAVCDDKLL